MQHRMASAQPSPIPAPAKPRTRRGNARDSILAAAQDCFIRSGIARTTIVDIAEAAGYSRPVIYKNFADKAEIVDQVCIQQMSRVREEMLRRLPASLPYADQLTEALLIAVLIARQDPFLQRFNEDQASWRRSQRRGEAVREWAKQLWIPFLRRGQAEGLLAADLDLDLTVTWLLLVQSQLIHRYEDEELDEAEMRALLRRYSIAPLVTGKDMA